MVTGWPLQMVGTLEVSQCTTSGTWLRRLQPQILYSSSPVWPATLTLVGKVTVAHESWTCSMMRFHTAGRSMSTAMMCAPSSLSRRKGPMAEVAPRRTKYLLLRLVHSGLRTASLIASPQSGSMVPHCTHLSTCSSSAAPDSSFSTPVWKHLYATLISDLTGRGRVPRTVWVSKGWAGFSLTAWPSLTELPSGRMKSKVS
mmetsp:Transcript_39050/g.103223  ORF Transcript_39050/g.103223 Transcript_39050/m.103223 type:complete len:200 (+) Transcript_39050:787-1386(+)